MSPAGMASRRSSRGKRPRPALARRPLPVEQVRDEDDRELEPLRLVQRHQPNAIDVLGQLHARRQLAAGRLVRVQIGDEPGQRPVRVGRLPVRGEPQEARDVGDHPLRFEGVGRDEVQHQAGPLEEALEDRVRALAEGQRVELIERAEQLAQLARGAAGLHLGRRASSCRSGRVDLDLADSTIALIVSSRCARSNFAIRLTRRISSASSRHGPAVIIRTSGGVVVRVRDGAERLLEVADLGRLEQAQPADDGVRDVLVAQPGDDRLAVLVLAVQDRDVRPARGRCRRLPRPP